MGILENNSSKKCAKAHFFNKGFFYMSSSGLFSLAKWRKFPQQKLIIITPVAKLPAGTQKYLRSIVGHQGPTHYLQVSTSPRSWGVTVFFISPNFAKFGPEKYDFDLYYQGFFMGKMAQIRQISKNVFQIAKILRLLPVRSQEYRRILFLSNFSI
jgi:hypothetical protein